MTSTDSSNPEAASALGLIAGGGEFPFMVIRGARQAGCRVVVLGIRGLADPALRDEADVFKWTGLARLGGWVRTLRRQKVTRCIMAGAVHKTAMYGRFRLLRILPDIASLKLWFFTVPDKRTDTVLGCIGDYMASKGITLENSVQYCQDDLAPEGVLTHLQPTAAQLRDIEFGWPIAKEMGRLDIGQSIAVKEQEVVAVEAIEGTDRMIERAGQLCAHGGWVHIKVAKPGQDMRFDVPTIGPATLENLHRNAAKVLVVEAGKTLTIQRDKMLAAARKYGIVVIGRRGG
ncbi:MAG: UDP-2,3-diacylglucosamine diphosphatase LpxI [Phycisphaerae bacterium]|nr:UDP-2,3-diacylglucosamine diphosphatase LpxI [Phycisphaerae bacterium]